MAYFKYVEPIFFLYAITLFYNIPIEKQLVIQKVCFNLYNSTFCANNNKSYLNPTQEENTIQSVSSKWFIKLNVARLVPTFLSTLVLGPLSDHLGRKKIIFLATWGETVNAIGYLLSAWYISSPVGYLLIQSVATGFCGNFLAILLSVLSYVGDTTDSESRTRRIIIVDIMIFVASIICYTSGGLIVKSFGFIAIYSADLVMYALAMVYLLFLKESLSIQESLSFKDAIGKIAHFGGVFCNVGSKRNFALVTACFCALFFITTGIDDVLILYLLHAPLTFKSEGIGFVLASEASARFFGALIVAMILIKKFRWTDPALMILASFALIGYSLSLAFSKINNAIYLSTLWGLGTGSGLGACRSSLSKMVSSSELGRLNSVLSVLQSLCLVTSSVVSNSVYRRTVSINPSITLYIIATICVVPVILSVTLKVLQSTGYQNLPGETGEEDGDSVIEEEVPVYGSNRSSSGHTE